MIVRLKETEKAAHLFEGWQETIIWSCLQKVMGEIYGDAQEDPTSAMALLGDFCFLAGEPDQELVLYAAGRCRTDFVIMVPQDGRWEAVIEACFADGAEALEGAKGPEGRLKKVSRYAIKKEPDIFDREKLQAIVDGLPAGYVLAMIDEDLFTRCGKTPWCRDLVAQYDDYDQYQRYGLGAVILEDGQVVSGASSYSSYLGGIEIEIDTREDRRRKGLALVCGAKLILECLERGWYPSWDAHNRGSVALAEKLGYHFDRGYTAYEVWGGGDGLSTAFEGDEIHQER